MLSTLSKLSESKYIRELYLIAHASRFATLHPPCEVGKIYAEGNVLYHMWEKKYTSLVNRFNTVESRLKEVKAIIVDKQARRDEVEYFIEDLKKQDLLTVFNENVWLSMVDYLTVRHDGKVDLIFLDGSKTELKC